jgi:hypothetical protein
MSGWRKGLEEGASVMWQRPWAFFEGSMILFFFFFCGIGA